jgi:hypothetical protein
MDNFDLKRFLVENKMTRNSRLLNESSSPYIILWQDSYHGGLIFITKQGKLIQDKILNELNLDPDNDFEENINEFINHPLYPSYQKEIEETEDLISDNISYLNKSPKFIQTCLQDLNNSDDYLYGKIGVVFIMDRSISDDMEDYKNDRKYQYENNDTIFVSLLEEVKYLNFQKNTIVPDDLGGDDLYLDIYPETISSFTNFVKSGIGQESQSDLVVTYYKDKDNYDEKGLADGFDEKEGKKVKFIVGYDDMDEMDDIGYIYSKSGKDIETDYTEDDLDDAFMNSLN